MSSQLAVDSTAPSDAELIARVRGGDTRAYGELFERHRDAANRLANQLVASPDADDLVSEAFIKVLRVLGSGGGPDVAFRPYLLTAVRRLHIDRIRSASRVTPSDEIENLDPGVPFADPAVAEFENSAAAKAFASLPERWQMVLWHLEVEGQKPADIAPLLGMSANSVSALAYRAREGLRQAYLQMHLADTAGETCRWTTERLGAHVRGGLAKRDAAKVEEHLDECPRCAAVYLELVEVNSNLRGIIAPLLLGAAATGYLASSGGTAAGAGFLGVLVGRVKDAVGGNVAASAGVAAATVVTVGAVVAAVTLGGGGDRGDVTGVAIESTEPGGQLPGAGPDSSDQAPGLTSPTLSSGVNSDATTTTPGGRTPATDLPTTGIATSTAGGVAPPGGLPADSGSTVDSTGTSGTGGSSSTASTTAPGTSGPRTGAPGTSTASTTRTTSTTTTRSSSPPTTTSSSPTTSTGTTSPPTTSETSPPTTKPPPPPVDMRLSLAGTRQDGPQDFRVAVTLAGVPDDATPKVTVRVARNNDLGFLGGWSCSPAPDRAPSTYVCTPGNNAGDLAIDVKFHPRGTREVSATVSAAGVDDVDPSNNSDSFQAPPVR
jgi:RNA polymerase sigma factor (sigma-70 family)